MLGGLAGTVTSPHPWTLLHRQTPAETGTWRIREQRPREGAAGHPEAIWAAGLGFWLECLGVASEARYLSGAAGTQGLCGWSDLLQPHPGEGIQVRSLTDQGIFVNLFEHHVIVSKMEIKDNSILGVS